MVRFENLYIYSIILIDYVVFSNMNMYLQGFMYLMLISEKEGYGFEGEQGGMYGIVWRGKKKEKKKKVEML